MAVCELAFLQAKCATDTACIAADCRASAPIDFCPKNNRNFDLQHAIFCCSCHDSNSSDGVSIKSVPVVTIAVVGSSNNCRFKSAVCNTGKACTALGGRWRISPHRGRQSALAHWRHTHALYMRHQPVLLALLLPPHPIAPGTDRDSYREVAALELQPELEHNKTCMVNSKG